MRSRKQTEWQQLLMESSLAYPRGKESKSTNSKREKTKRDKTLGYLGVVKPVTPGEGVPLRGTAGWSRTDGGLEFCNQEFEKYLDKLRIRHAKTNPYRPEMNGVAERFTSLFWYPRLDWETSLFPHVNNGKSDVSQPNRRYQNRPLNLTALDGVLKFSDMSQKCWVEVLLCFTYSYGKLCSIHKKMPFELYSDWKLSDSPHLNKFGCVAYVGVPKQTRKKLDIRAKLGIMCGYARTTKRYRILFLEDQRVIETINVRFDEIERGIDLVQDSKGSSFTLKNFQRMAIFFR
ncbi:hypothetical protein AVEN_22231-1 [Araneus ventricosus]|uniref:Integrase catalytic domain-containing protein n=1 Tax=Araneus ventricosus TaxID=182803 RepID=A0A4Y2TW65_ARAVE|nr:hypothetical protein AVEN_22231-1 [Araneus ventricosus]